MERAADAIAWVDRSVKRDAVDPAGLGGQMFKAADAGEITEPEAELLVRTLFAAGSDTTIYGIGSMVRAFAENPEQYALVRENPKLARNAFEEVLRYESPSRFGGRATKDVTEIDGVTLPAGARLMIMFLAAGRDERKWENPHSFDVTRKVVGHVNLGYGIHACAGQALARIEGQADPQRADRQGQGHRARRRARAGRQLPGPRARAHPGPPDPRLSMRALLLAVAALLLVAPVAAAETEGTSAGTSRRRCRGRPTRTASVRPTSGSSSPATASSPTTRPSTRAAAARTPTASRATPASSHETSTRTVSRRSSRTSTPVARTAVTSRGSSAGTALATSRSTTTGATAPTGWRTWTPTVAPSS